MNKNGEITTRTLVIIIATLVGIFILAMLFFRTFNILK